MRSWVHSVKPLGDFPAFHLAPSTAAANEPSIPPLLESLSDTTGSKDGPLAHTLALLFEPSPVLYDALVPALASQIHTAPPPSSTTITSYHALVDASLAVVSAWQADRQAQFVAAHPRIGEVRARLSQLSAQEQEQAAKATPTPPEVLARLAHLNACYERRYPGLVYITFVNGRSRAEIKDELEDKLGLEHSLSADEPPVESVESVEVGGEEWRGELERAVSDVGRIAKSRLEALGIADAEA